MLVIFTYNGNTIIPSTDKCKVLQSPLARKVTFLLAVLHTGVNYCMSSPYDTMTSLRHIYHYCYIHYRYSTTQEGSGMIKFKGKTK